MRLRAMTAVAAALLFAGTGAADAAVRYAEPGGDGPAGSCPRANPCDIQVAVEDPAVADGDEVVVRPGTYDLANNELIVTRRIELHGPDRPGQPVAAIHSANPSTATLRVLAAAGQPDVHHLHLSSMFDDAVEVAAGRIHDLTGTTMSGDYALDAVSSMAVIERVVMVNESGLTGCAPPPLPGLLRDSVCFVEGSGARAVSVAFSGGGTFDYRLRNVTAIATAGASFGLFAHAEGNIDIEVDARNVIADAPLGVVSDAWAETEGANSTAVINLAHSNFDLANDTGTGASVTAPGSGTNQTEEYLLADPADGDFTQLPTSPTINAGGPGQLGLMDFERQPRVQGAAPDIGADERDTGRLKLKLKAKRSQNGPTVSVKAQCVAEDCNAKLRGKIVVAGASFKLKPVKRFLYASEAERLKLKAKGAGKLKAALAADDGRATIKARAIDATGADARKRKRVQLTS